MEKLKTSFSESTYFCKGSEKFNVPSRKNSVWGTSGNDIFAVRQPLCNCRPYDCHRNRHFWLNQLIDVHFFHKNQ